MCLVYFEKAFDSVDRAALWRSMRRYGFPEKIVKMVEVNYNGIYCFITDGPGQEYMTGFRSGLLSYLWWAGGVTRQKRHGEHGHQMEVQNLPG